MIDKLIKIAEKTFNEINYNACVGRAKYNAILWAIKEAYSLDRISDADVIETKKNFFDPKDSDKWDRKELVDHVVNAINPCSEDTLFRFLLEIGYIERKR